jgi:hypothetical protein
MNPIQRGNRDLIRNINRSILLNLIKSRGQVSRVALAHMAGLSPATVTTITGYLIKEGLVFEKAVGDSAGGRPPIMLALNPRGGFVIGIKLMEGRAVGALTDLNAMILAKDSIELADKQVETSVKTLVTLVNRLIQSSGIKKKQLMGVGIGLAGVVDFTRGIVRPNQVNLKMILSSSLLVAVSVWALSLMARSIVARMAGRENWAMCWWIPMGRFAIAAGTDAWRLSSAKAPWWPKRAEVSVKTLPTWMI